MYKLYAEACVACPFASLFTVSLLFHGRFRRRQDPDSELVHIISYRLRRFAG